MNGQKRYPKFENSNQEAEYLTKKLGFSNMTAHNIMRMKKAVLKRMEEVKK